MLQVGGLYVQPPDAQRASTAVAPARVPNGTWAIARAIVAEEGAKGLLRGLSINYLKVRHGANVHALLFLLDKHTCTHASVSSASSIQLR